MTEQASENQQKSGKGKIGIIIAIVAVLLIGGAIAAFTLLSTSDKQTYFKAEKESYNALTDEFEERFADELAWLEVTEENPTESVIDLSAEYKDPYAFGGVSEMEEIVNNSTVKITSQADLKGEKLFANIEADVAGMKFEDIRFGLTDTTLLLELPFLKDVLQLESEDLSELLHEIDPYTFEEGTSYDFSQVFNQEDNPIPKEDREYLADKYGKLVYDELPDDAFSSEKEKVEVDGESIKAEKVTMHLTEENVQTLVTNLVEEIEKDKRLKEIIEAYFEDNFMPDEDLKMFMDDFNQSLADMKEDVDKITLPEGIKSTIWVQKDLIVKRDFNLTTEDGYDEEIAFQLKGTQLLKDGKQKFNYDLNVKDEYSDESITLAGDLSRDGDAIKDEVTVGFDEFEVIYEGDETLKKSDRDFTRSLSVKSPYMSGGLFWTGDSKYEKDQMSANHQLHVEADDIGEDMLNVQIGVEGKKVKEIESIDTKNVKDLGKMSEAELDEYIEGEAAEQFFKWYMDKFGAAGF